MKSIGESLIGLELERSKKRKAIPDS